MKRCYSPHKDVSGIEVGGTFFKDGIEYVILRKRVVDGITVISTERKLDPIQRALRMREIRRSVEDYLRANNLKFRKS